MVQSLNRFSLLLVVWLAALLPAHAADTNNVYLYTFFREPNGQNGLQLATSTDGLKWTELKAPNGSGFLKP